ncbi:uncharacterized protein LOC133930140 [Phragmites australis]|uniref:uncharacterized protein LOC133930140 n=1 Tax=Phragmites australis TaxID=29695 RepID=UPI002D79B752|nr:uncharacterized protein LOC133930140 [Phragmites australis]
MTSARVSSKTFRSRAISSWASSIARCSSSLAACTATRRALKEREAVVSCALPVARAARSASSCATSPAMVASSRPITSRELPSTTGRGSVGWLGCSWVLGPLRASSGGLGVLENYRTVIHPGLGALGAGSDGAGRSDGGCVTISATASVGPFSTAAFAGPISAAASVSPISAAVSAGPRSAGALGSGALGSGAGASLGASGCPWPSAVPTGGLLEKDKD